ncbi:methylenetetrahydrofolate reductase [NAD(P)H] [Puniceicoccales bacterium CK1056]|uniref:Methylenetetrahydrofolate reductase n=1 Tax=Oceanipulchritudo coccoides TaxID=2706888 RepID=A0A6B2M646_9BACT|nr:methylenetetrahydrofolate reductase [NAD(P)H] [Oceanipulchritudo coccoides]NDV63275.1 methylenetetrahydrofolate reductase [NAD(P)H] [Oceanipulchritudo coccoides]
MSKNRPITEFLSRNRPVISVEFFPPKDESGGEQIVAAAKEIREQIDPDFVSITYGAGGGTRERTYRYASILKDEYGFEVMPHLTCVGSSREELLEIISAYQAAGFCNIMALRGDPPSGESTFTPHPDGLPYAGDLVKLIRDNYSGFSIGVAGYPEVHPEATSAEDDLCHLKGKVDAGASFITTQLFYDNANFLEFVKRCQGAGIDIPIIPGLMPIRSAKQAKRFCQHIPAELEAALEAAGDDPKKTREVGVDWTHRQIAGLMDAGIKAFHMYIMNRSGMAVEVIKRLRQSGRL